MSARDELATLIASKLDSIFGSRDFGPATQDFQLADELIAAGYGKLPEPAPEAPPARAWPAIPERGDREYRQAQWDHARTPERYGGGLG